MTLVDEKYLKMKNWEKYQHYKDRRPPWIKLHVEILNDRKFSMLSMAQRGLLMQLWVLASRSDGKILLDVEELKFQLHSEEVRIEDINTLISMGFLIYASSCKQMQASAPRSVSVSVSSSVSVKGDNKGGKPLTEMEKRKLKAPENTPDMIRIGAWFGRKPTTLWTLCEKEALDVLGALDADDMNILAEFYKKYDPEEGGSNCELRKKDVATLLNNWQQQCDRAHGWQKSQRVSIFEKEREEKRKQNESNMG